MNLKNRHWLIVGIAITIGLGVAFYPRLTGKLSRTADPAQLAQGQAVYDKHCAACHGKNLEGQPNWRERRADGRLPAPPHDETGHTWHHPDRVLFRIVKEGLAWIGGPNYRTDMPAYQDVLTDEEIHAVLAYIKSRWPEPVRAQQREIDRADQLQG